jgi:hypothetical protein
VVGGVPLDARLVGGDEPVYGAEHGLVRGTSLRMTYLLGSIRVHQSGGLPIHAASTRHPSHPRPPPPQRGGSHLIGVKAVRPRAHALRALRLDPRDAATVKHGRGTDT